MLGTAVREHVALDEAPDSDPGSTGWCSVPRTTRTALLAGIALAAMGSLAAAQTARDPVDDALLEVYLHDRPYRVTVPTHESLSPEGDRVFGDLPSGTRLHPSYEATWQLCQDMDPWNQSDDEVPEAKIDAYLESVRDMAPLLEAFHVTGRDSLEDLKNAWFRRGRGFEHVICGESGGRDEGTAKLGGYHFWYVHYRNEQVGKARYIGADYGSDDPQAGMADDRIVSGLMSWDPDGPGGRPAMEKKPRGGFIVGNSVATILAAGHMAFYGGKAKAKGKGKGGRDGEPAPAAVDLLAANPESKLYANLNGKVYLWTFHRMQKDGGSSIRTFWPRWVPDVRALSELPALP